VPGGSTVLGNAAAGISTTSATLPAGNTGGFVQISATAATGVGQILATPTVRVSIASSTPVFLIANGNFPSGTCTVNGFIRARRVR
jgi:hypothetical protein